MLHVTTKVGEVAISYSEVGVFELTLPEHFHKEEYKEWQISHMNEFKSAKIKLKNKMAEALKNLKENELEN